jgi:uncharacterized protein YihD (DUF1040 family)
VRNPKRIEGMLESLRMLWVKQPDIRLGQLIVNLCGSYDPYYIEDDKLDDVMWSKINES